MGKAGVYKWRVPPSLQAELKRVARERKVTISWILDRAAREWLSRNRTFEPYDEETQRKLHAKVERYVGVLTGDDPHRAENARELVRKRLRERYDRERHR